MQIAQCHGRALRDLTLNRQSQLRYVGRLEIGVEAISRKRRHCSGQGAWLRSIGKEIRVGDGEGLLRDSIQSPERHQIILRKAIVKDSSAGTDDGFGRATPTKSPRKAEPGREAAVVADHILDFVAQTAAQYHVGAHLPVILNEATEINIVG